MAVDFVSRDLHESFRSGLARCFQQHPGATHIGVDKGGSIQDRAIDMRLRREVDDPVYPVNKPRHKLSVADVASDETIARVLLNWPQIVWVAGVGQLVENGDLCLAVLAEDVANEGRADEAGSA